MNPNEAAAVETWLAYYRTSQSDPDPSSILPYYHVPCLIVAPQAVVALNTDAQVSAFVLRSMEALREIGMGLSEISDIQARGLGAETTVLSLSILRRLSNGEIMERVDASYTLRNTPAGWKIAVVTIGSAL